jgi:hypothetical protein
MLGNLGSTGNCRYEVARKIRFVQRNRHSKCALKMIYTLLLRILLEALLSLCIAILIYGWREGHGSIFERRHHIT